MKLFDWLDNLTTGKKQFCEFKPEEQKTYSIYQINRFVSMVEIYIKVINQINKYQDLTPEHHHNLLLSVLPKRKQYFNYIKKGKGSDLESPDDIKNIMEYFECSKKEAMLYLNLLGNDIETIKGLYKKHE